MEQRGAQPEHFDAVVIGSGFGGAVAAYQLIKEQKLTRVLLLERGMPYPPGSFPRTPREMRRNFWAPAHDLHGLYEVWAFSKVRAIVASGLGGGSLIYANVLLPIDEDDPPPWAEWQALSADLDAGYKEAACKLKPTTLPHAAGGAARDKHGGVRKTDDFIAAAQDAGLTPELAPIAVTFSTGLKDFSPGMPFGNPGENLHKKQRHTCTLVGECDVGCNQGAKNSLDFNYLTAFANDARATIRTCCEAVRISVDGDTYAVRYVEHRQARERVQKRLLAEGRRDDLDLLDESGPASTDDTGVDHTRSVKAPVVVLAAGTFGSTRLLLASRTGLPRLSRQLGRYFSTNGDLLTFARGCRDRDADHWRDLDPSTGPVITAYAASRSENEHRMWLEDAGGPASSQWLWQTSEMPGDLRSLGSALKPLLRGRFGGRIGHLLARSLGSASASSAMLPLLTMGHDVSGGRLRLEGDGLSLDWNPTGRSREYFDDAEGIARTVANRLGGRLRPTFFARWSRGLTVHPLGGCPMATNPSNGVVDANGEVHGHKGLFVADGSIMPGPVGPNPSFTIAAFARRIGKVAAERAAERIS